MTRASTDAAVQIVERSPTWGVFRYYTPQNGVDYSVGRDDFERDVAWAATFLGDYEIGRGSVVCFVGNGARAAWLEPVMTAAKRAGACACYAGDWPLEAGRVTALLRYLPISMVLGLSAAVTEVLLESDDARTMLERPTLLAEAPVRALLAAKGLTAHSLEFVGPMLAIECYEGGLHVNSTEWTCVDTDGQVRVSTTGPRAHDVADQAVGFAARIEGARCRCGRTDVRLLT